MIVAGVMSGTSADGINVALVRVAGKGFRTRFELLAHSQQSYPRAVRQRVLDAMNADSARVADLARLNFLLGELYADAVRDVVRRKRVRLDLVGCHGQTLYHQGEPTLFLGRRLSATWQTGEGAILAARLGVPVVSDFRPADIAAKGKGAPLVPFLDYLLYRHHRIGRIIQNIGGIANLTAIPASASPDQVVAFDTGPGNMVIDAVTERLCGKPYDRDGRLAGAGKIVEFALNELLKLPFFRKPPPKTAGREQFGREFVDHFLWLCKNARPEDAIATATALTAHTIALAVQKQVASGGNFRDLVVSGGGVRNATLMRMLASLLSGLRVRRSDEFGLPAEAKEAVAFALLAHQTWHRLPSNLPAATGARSAAVLGKVSYP